MFSYELFDFVSTGHPSDVHVDPSDQYHDSLFDSYIDSSYVDQSFCSDFACCGQNLPDLHRLLEHFEEEHVLPLSSSARPLCSSPVYAQPRSAASAPYTSYILSYPQPDPPLQAVTHSISASSGPDSRALPSLQFSTIPPVPDLTHTPLSPSPSASSATSAHSSPGPAEPLCLPPSLFSVQHTPPPRSRRDRPRVRDASDTDADVDDTDEEAEADAEFADAPPARPAPMPKLPLSLSGNSAGPHRRAKHCSAARMHPVSAPAARSRPVDRERERVPLSPATTPKRRGDGREKSYKCPSYLNPNGLKYHLEKGTCTNAGVRGREPLPPVPASVSLPCHVPTTPAAIATAVRSASVPCAVAAEDGDAACVDAAEVRA
ncbi:hypothetical protein LXA43DRAFT_1099236 [Ganoderma leucocontextum]|nr:hypothetical protein LXA43DRAFT_1099236 [Ganoderma leucocontextum]